MVIKDTKRNKGRQKRNIQSIIDEMSKGVKMKTRKIRKIERKNEITSFDKIPIIKEKPKQKIKVLRIRRFRNLTKFFRREVIFQNNPLKFYWEIGRETINIKKTHTIEELKSFSGNTWNHKKSSNKKEKWIENIKVTYKNNEPQMYEDITIEEIINTLKRTHKWKSLGIDKMTNFWFHHLSSTHQLITKLISEINNEPEKIRDYFRKRLTYILPKTKEITNTPKKYRPITCLPTCRMITSILSERIIKLIEYKNSFPLE